MRNQIKAYKGMTGISKQIGQSVDEAVHGGFIGKISIPLQIVEGKAISSMNRKGLVTDNVITGHNMDALLAENAHALLMEKTINIITEYLTGYGSVVTNRTSKRGKWTTHWMLTLEPAMFKLMEKEDKGFRGVTLKKLRNSALQSLFADDLGINTDVIGIDKAYLEGMKEQYVDFVLNEEELKDHLLETYSESKRMANNTIRYTPTKQTKKLAEAHLACIRKLDGKSFPITEQLEPRGRTAKQLHSMLGMNLYGKTWETQSFRLGEKTVAYDARQSGYQLAGALLGVKPLSRITGTYGKTGGGDIYVSSFKQAVDRVFPAKDVERDIVKKSAQMLIYMAGMKQILLSDDLGLGSLWSHLSSEDDDLEIKCAELEVEFWNQAELEPIMELRQAVRDGQFANYAVPTWNFPGTSDYFFSRSDTNFMAWGAKGQGMIKEASIFMIGGDDGKNHQMTMHVSMIRELAKGSAILAAIFHSNDALLKKLVCLDVWAAGGKIVVKHDEFIVNEEHKDVMIESYHRWLAHIASNREEYLQKPLEQCGFMINLDSMVQRNELRFGKYYPSMITRASNGLAFEWEVVTEPTQAKTAA